MSENAIKSIFQSQWNALAILFFLSFVYFMENFDRYLIAVSPIPYIDYSSYEYSILAGPAFTIVYTLGGLLFALGYSSNSNEESSVMFSKFNILAAATFIFSFAFASTAFAVNFWQQVVVRIAMGITQSLVTPFSTSIISDHFAPVMRGSAFGIFNAGTYFAFSLSLSLGTFIYINFGWQAGYVMFGILGIGLALCIPLLACFANQTESAESDSRTSLLGGGIENTASEQTKMLLPPSGGLVDERIPDSPCSPERARSAASNTGGTCDQSSMSGSIDTAAHARLGSLNPMVNPYSYTTNTGATGDRSDAPPLESSNVDETISFSSDTDTRIDENNHNSGGNIVLSSRFYAKIQQMKSTLYQIIWVHWRSHPGMYTLCLATGIRLGGGYIWSAYTSVFFSDLFVLDEDSSCDFSYNSSSTYSDSHYHSDGLMLLFPPVFPVMNTSSENVGADGFIQRSLRSGSVCEKDFPYCVDGECFDLIKYPWHNKGLDPVHLETFMSWVPILGSALGSLLGGLLSDYVIRKQREARVLKSRSISGCVSDNLSVEDISPIVSSGRGKDTVLDRRSGPERRPSNDPTVSLLRAHEAAESAGASRNTVLGGGGGVDEMATSNASCSSISGSNGAGPEAAASSAVGTVLGEEASPSPACEGLFSCHDESGIGGESSAGKSRTIGSFKYESLGARDSSSFKGPVATGVHSGSIGGGNGGGSISSAHRGGMRRPRRSKITSSSIGDAGTGTVSNSSGIIPVSVAADNEQGGYADAEGEGTVRPIATDNDHDEPVDQSFRMLIAGVSNLLAMPLAVAALFLDFPYCFLIFIPSGMIGELYLGQALALLTDESVVPNPLLTASVALFMFVVTLVGGNVPVLVPWVTSLVGYRADVHVTFDAECTDTGLSASSAKEVKFRVAIDDAKQLQYSLAYLLCFCYIVSGLLYLVGYRQMKNGATARHGRASTSYSYP